MFYMTFEQARDYLYSLERFGWKLGLERIEQLLKDLDNPEKECRFIHIAGTNGKGSVAAMLESIFRTAGYSTGLYTSPHLVDVRERVRMNGDMISEADFARIMSELRKLCDMTPSTFFEVMTALAFEYFKEKKTDIVILETGLGGRFDATNVVTPLVSVITSIDLEHTRHLGVDLASIAFEKAGIVKPEVPCVTGDLAQEAESVIKRICRKKNSEFHAFRDSMHISNVKLSTSGTNFEIEFYDNNKQSVSLPLFGEHQVVNAGIAVAAAHYSGYDLKFDQILQGLQSVVWDGRFQFIRHDPPLILDVAHNTASIDGLFKVLRSLYPQKKLHVMMGLLDDKDVSAICRIMAPHVEQVMLVRPESDRSMDVERLQREFRLYQTPVEIQTSLQTGLTAMLKNQDPNIVQCITGSHYIAGEVKSLINSLTS